MQNETTQRKAIRREFQGEVVSATASKTISVLVRTVKVHPKYRKHYVTTRKYPVHDELGKAVVGDKVRFEECRPISKTKRWRLVSPKQVI